MKWLVCKFFLSIISYFYILFKKKTNLLFNRQCLSICCARSPESGVRLGTTPVGLLPLAAAATGQGIRSRILALQLLSNACDKATILNGTQRSIANGNSAVSEALSTLRLRCGEPVRFRLLVGMLNSGGGSGELQAIGLRYFIRIIICAHKLDSNIFIYSHQIC